MTIVDVVFAIATVGFALAWTVPTVRKLLMTQSVNGVSASMLAFTIGGSSLWALTGWQERSTPVLVTSLLYIAGAATALVLAVRFGAKFPWRAALVVVAIAVYAVFGPTPFAVVMLSFAATRFVTQVVAVMRSADISGVSAGAWMSTATEGVVWLAYGIVAGLWPAAAWGTMAAMAGVIIAGKSIRYSRSVASARL